MLFYHAKVKFVRSCCTKGARCPEQYFRQHARRFSHPPAEMIPAGRVWGHNTCQHLMQEDETALKVSFHQNAKALMDKIRYFVKGQAPDDQEKAAAVSFWQSCRPVHRLPVTSFAKVLKTGFLGSQHCLQTAHVQDSEFAMQLPSVVALVSESPAEHITAIQEFVEACVRHDVFARQASRNPLLQPTMGQEVAPDAVGGQKAQVQNSKQELNTKRNQLGVLFRKSKLQTLETELSGFLQAFSELQAATWRQPCKASIQNLELATSVTASWRPTRWFLQSWDPTR